MLKGYRVYDGDVKEVLLVDREDGSTACIWTVINATDLYTYNYIPPQVQFAQPTLK